MAERLENLTQCGHEGAALAGREAQAHLKSVQGLACPLANVREERIDPFDLRRRQRRRT